ncbi:hypothetical protein GMOD_00004300 [Pyrenophora seminiperda CCB06]|uniref:Uncharacterized protein n=1 Tax=Pyrenophora seminiperda CCB06 TaxID=1302712 RepID=A0A3M7M111_9PLEO|nr:hypothetical protein GMOD_00004300 [Pyrenophora seminiperda CCB06]
MNHDMGRRRKHKIMVTREKVVGFFCWEPPTHLCRSRLWL